MNLPIILLPAHLESKNCRRCVWCGRAHTPWQHLVGWRFRQTVQHYVALGRFIIVEPEGRS